MLLFYRASCPGSPVATRLASLMRATKNYHQHFQNTGACPIKAHFSAMPSATLRSMSLRLSCARAGAMSPRVSAAVPTTLVATLRTNALSRPPPPPDLAAPPPFAAVSSSSSSAGSHKGSRLDRGEAAWIGQLCALH